MKNLIRKHDFQKEILRIETYFKHINEENYRDTNSMLLEDMIKKIFEVTELDEDGHKSFLLDEHRLDTFVREIKLLAKLKEKIMKQVVLLPDTSHQHKKLLQGIVLKTGKLHDLLVMRYWNEYQEFLEKKN